MGCLVFFLIGRFHEQTILVTHIFNPYNVEFYIEYGTSTGIYTNQTTIDTATANQDIELVIGSLSANTCYYYRIVYRTGGATDWTNGKEHSFITQRPAGSTFTFDTTSDNHLGQYGGQTTNELASWQITLQNIPADHPDFLIDTGDTFPMDPSPLVIGMTDAEAKHGM